MGLANKYLSQARRIELYEEQMRQFSSFKTVAAAELKALPQRFGEVDARIDEKAVAIQVLEGRVVDLERKAAQLEEYLDTLAARRRLDLLTTALAGSWRERREARRALNG